ncbi:OmpA family protein [Bacteroides eggerthii]|jgi:OOP family OmpA-OmpF porin|uniref:OmpA family protein n=1 Tax=Bacteroides eggerthii TaxID=28111 RepID=UPI0022E88B18|nr:OmpA family protein [Bacteroides eggerthii]
MKKIVASLVLCMAVIAANAQKAVEGNKFTDNWSVGFNAGGTTPLTHSAFFKNMRAVLGVGLDKQVTPVLGLGFEAMTSINTTPSRTAFDNTNLSVLGTLNLSNLFGGYAGAPRLFEVETVAGIGWLHYAVNGESDLNSMSSKLGLNFNFNLGEEKAWTLAFKPALVYDMSADGTDNVCFNANRAAWEFTAGLKYHFSCSNGKHYFTIVKPYNQSEIDALNDQINNMRREADDNAAALKNANQKAADLEKALNDCKNQVPKVITETVTNNKKTLESVVTFRQGGTSVESSQTPNVERIATYLKNHKNATVSIKGYASPEGNADVNARIAKQRAESVKNMLINRYKIAANRITAEGQGVGNMFEEPDWNRVSICTINED